MNRRINPRLDLSGDGQFRVLQIPSRDQTGECGTEPVFIGTVADNSELGLLVGPGSS